MKPRLHRPASHCEFSAARPPARIRRRLRAALVAGALAALAGCAGAPAAIDPGAGLPPGSVAVALPSGEPIGGLPALVARARGVDVLVVGERHDDPAHQQVQAALARALDVRALALEMTPRSAEPGLAALRAAPAPTPALREAAAWDDYAPWHGVIEAVPAARVAGGGVARDDLRRAMREGVAAAFGPEPARYGLDRPLPASEQAALEEELAVSHCGALPEAMLAPMAEAQRLRDARFAEALLRAREAAARDGAPERPAMLVAGDGHVRRDRGVPYVLATAAPDLSTLAILQAEFADGVAGATDPAAIAAALAPWRRADGALPFDLAVITPAPEGRGDPCAAFRKPGG